MASLRNMREKPQIDPNIKDDEPDPDVETFTTRDGAASKELDNQNKNSQNGDNSKNNSNQNDNSAKPDNTTKTDNKKQN